MKSSTHDSRGEALWRGVVDRWNRTPGYLKWIGGIVLGALVRYLVAHLFPESWERVERRLVALTMPIWLAVGILVAVVVLERAGPALYRRVRARRMGGVRLHPLFGVRWAVPPAVERVQGPYCAVCPARLRAALWSGDASPTLWTCPSCGREFSTPEFPDITSEAARRLGTAPR